MMAIPLTAGEEKIGLMEVINKSGGEPFTDDERLLLDSIAEEIAFAIRNARIFEYVVNSCCKQRQGATSWKGCQRRLKSWTPCVKYLEKGL
jgi:K+-sensing histidine kinase KdpD